VTNIVNNKLALEKSEHLIRIESNKQSLKIITFNCKNCLTCGPFFNEAMKYMNVCLIQEHWLFNCQIDLFNEIHENLIGIGKSVDDKDPIQPSHMPRGYGGVGILWRKEIDHLISVVAIGNERIQCVEMRGTSRKLILVSIYMPCKGAPNNVNDFQECRHPL